MDFRYQLDGQLRSPLAKAIQDAGEKYVDIVKVHVAEDTWRPTNLETSKNLQKLLSELDDLGVTVPSSYLTNNCWIQLTNNTLTFSKLYVSLLEDCLSVATPELMATIDGVLVSVMRAQVQHVCGSLTDPKLKQEVMNVSLINYIVMVVIKKYLISSEATSARQRIVYSRRGDHARTRAVQISDESNFQKIARS